MLGVRKDRAVLLASTAAIALIVAAVLLAPGLSWLGGATLPKADQAFASHRIARAADLYARVAEESLDPLERSEAARRVALLQWRFYDRPQDARETLAEAVRWGEEAPDLLAALAELEIAQGSFGPARVVASRSLAQARTAEEERIAHLRWAEAAVEELQTAVKDGAALDTELLADATAVLTPMVEEESGALEPSRLLLRAALLAGDGPRALDAWRSYYRVPPGGKPYNLLEDAYRELQLVLPVWKPQETPAETERIIRALAASRLFEEAALLARAPATPPTVRASVRQLVAYADFVERIERVTNEYYRLTAIEQGEPVDLLRGLLGETLSAWHALELPGEPPHVGDPSALRMAEARSVLEEISPVVEPTLAERYGAYVNLGETAGTFDLHMGHEALAEARTIEQYGQTAELRFILLDSMVSNGFQSWAWAYTSQHGGWTEPEAIYQVRPAYAGGPLRDWRRLTDPDERQEWKQKIEKLGAEDDAIARNDPHAYLPGLQQRLKLAALEDLYRSLEAEGLSGSDLRRAFLRRLEDSTQESSIFAHEGRHAIDGDLGIDDNAELEFRAKLSEIAFSSMPRNVVAGPILNPNLGDDTPHGQANLRVIRGLVGWMEVHGEEVAGLDSSRPLLPQLDLLTPDQLRSAARSVDPLADQARHTPPRGARF